MIRSWLRNPYRPSGIRLKQWCAPDDWERAL